MPAKGLDTYWLCTGDDVNDFEVLDACIQPDFWHEKLSPRADHEDDEGRHAEPAVAPTTDTCGRQAEQSTDSDRSSSFFESAKVQSLIEKAITDRTEVIKLAGAAMGSKIQFLLRRRGHRHKI